MQQTLRFAVRSRSLPCCFWGEFGPRAARRQSEILIERKLSETIYSTKKTWTASSMSSTLTTRKTARTTSIASVAQDDPTQRAPLSPSSPRTMPSKPRRWSTYSEKLIRKSILPWKIWPATRATTVAADAPVMEAVAAAVASAAAASRRAA
uniref:GH06343p n=1 Tax=Drosophila melanogaster TaxID=7227 RepID=Q5LK30_DROME|nr:GH06343p [Drosophila melanogaster]